MLCRIVKNIIDTMSGIPFDWKTLAFGSPSGVSFVLNQVRDWTLFEIKQLAVKTK